MLQKKQGAGQGEGRNNSCQDGPFPTQPEATGTEFGTSPRLRLFADGTWVAEPSPQTRSEPGGYKCRMKHLEGNSKTFREEPRGFETWDLAEEQEPIVGGTRQNP